jgi:hypothetical protein
MRQQLKDLCTASFDAMGQVYHCWWRICREINVFQVRISLFCFISICDLFTDSSSYVNIQNGLACVNKVKLSCTQHFS